MASKEQRAYAGTEVGNFMHPVESEMLCSLTMPTKVPYFNAPIYLSNKTQIGKVDEILGPINEVFFTVKMEQGMLASSFKKEDKVYIGGDKLLPIERFLPKPKVPGQDGKSESCSLDYVLACYKSWESVVWIGRKPLLLLMDQEGEFLPHNSPIPVRRLLPV